MIIPVTQRFLKDSASGTGVALHLLFLDPFRENIRESGIFILAIQILAIQLDCGVLLANQIFY